MDFYFTGWSDTFYQTVFSHKWDLQGSLSLSEFWSKYEIAYGQRPSNKKNKKTNLIPLLDNKGFIRIGEDQKLRF